MTAPNTPTPELVKQLRKEIPYNADGFRELRDLADEAAAAIAKLTAERDAFEARLISCDANLTHTLKEYTEMTLERDRAERRAKDLEASLTIALNDVVLHDMVAQGERSANKLLSERVAVLETALAYAREHVIRYAHTQGDSKQFHTDLLAPIEAALGGSK